MHKNLKANTIYNIIKSFANIIYPLITFPYISRVLMASNVGKINFVSSFISYFSLLASLGISTYAVRECSKVKNEKSKLNGLASEIYSISIISTIIAYVALGVTLILARRLESYRTLICIQSCTIVFTTLGADWINTAMEDLRYITIRTVLVQVLSVVLMICFVRKPDDYVIYTVLTVLSSSGANIVNIFYRKKYCNISFTLKMNIRKHIKPIFLLFSMIIAQTIYCNSDIIMIGLIKGDFQVGLYSVSVKIYNIVNSLVASISLVVIPQLSLGFEKEDYTQVNRVLKYALNFIIVIGMPCLIGLNVICKPILGLVGGEEFLNSNISLHILTFSLACSFFGGWMTNMILLPSGKEVICMKCGIICAVVNVILNIALIPFYGINGAAFTTFVAEFIGVIFVSRYIDKRIKIDNIFEIIKAPIIGSMLIGIIGITISRIFKSFLLITILTIFISIIFYTIVLLVCKNEFFISYVGPIVRKIKRRSE